jgi:hypothetical protein
MLCADMCAPAGFHWAMRERYDDQVSPGSSRASGAGGAGSDGLS